MAKANRRGLRIARAGESEFAARDLGDELEPMYPDSPSGDSEPLEPVDDDAAPSGKEAPAAPSQGRRAMSARVAALPPATRAQFTYLARLARSLTEGQVDSRPIPPAQRARGVVLVVQVLPDGRRVVFR
jgi:hypothetical protein